MPKKDTEDQEPKPTVMEKLDNGRNTVDQVMSFVDWIRYVIDWVKGLFNR